MADNNKVTIDAAWFAELWRTANEADEACENCVSEMCGECKVVKERDELKARLDGDATANGLSPATQELLETERRLAAAERCIDDCWGHIACGTAETISASLGAIEDIIRAYREAKEAAR